MARTIAWAAILLAAILLPFAADLAGQTYYVGFATRILVFALAALALDLVLGYGGSNVAQIRAGVKRLSEVIRALRSV